MSSRTGPKLPDPPRATANRTGPNAVNPTLIAVIAPRIESIWVVPKYLGKEADSSARMLPPAAPMAIANTSADHPGATNRPQTSRGGGGAEPALGQQRDLMDGDGSSEHSR